MTYLAAAVVLVGAVSAVNLVLVLAVVRRLREGAGEPGPGHPRGPAPRPVLPPGARPGPFQTATDDGEPVGSEPLAGCLVGFFTPQCPLCHERLPDFVAYARRAGLRRTAVLAVLVGEPEQTAALRDDLAPVARIVHEPHGGGPLYRAFAVTGLPAYCLLDADGVIVASGTDLAGFPAVAVAR
jgi:hypothetical protein